MTYLEKVRNLHDSAKNHIYRLTGDKQDSYFDILRSLRDNFYHTVYESDDTDFQPCAGYFCHELGSAVGNLSWMIERSSPKQDFAMPHYKMDRKILRIYSSLVR